MSRLKRMPFSERLREIAQANGPEACWDWPGFCFDGYGKCAANLDERGGRVWFAHRAAYTVLIGPVSPDAELDHLCRNRRCMNPAHLEPVTPRENALRSKSPTAFNAKKTHCKHGHEFTPENTRHFTTRYGTQARSCKRCLRDFHDRKRLSEGKPLHVGSGYRPVATHCKRGHEFTPENTIVKKTGRRGCRACARVCWREFAQKKRDEEKASRTA